jgi:hypothetical protein
MHWQGGSSRQGCESGRVKVLAPSIACFGRLACPVRAEVTKHDMPGCMSSRQGCGSSWVKVPVPPIACIRAASISGACGGNKARDARTYKPRLPSGHRTAAVGTIWGVSKTRGLNIKECLQLRKAYREKSCSRKEAGSRPSYILGKADDKEEETGMSTPWTAGVWGQASGERFAEIMSGRTICQQGLTATCKDCRYKAKAEIRQRWVVWRMSQYERRRRGNARRSSGMTLLQSW